MAFLFTLFFERYIPAMEQFKLKPEGFKELRNTMLKRAVPSLLIASAGGLAISHFNPNAPSGDVSVLPVVIPMLLGAAAFGLYRGIKRQKQIFDSYILTLHPDSISREQHNTPTISIAKTEVSEIIRNPDGGFTIKGNSAVNLIGVPAQVDEYEKLEKALSAIKEITIKTAEPVFQKFQSLGALVMVGLMAAVYISTNKLVVGICGPALLVLMGYSFFEIQRSKNIDNKTKRIRWWLILIAMSVIGIMFFKLTARP